MYSNDYMSYDITHGIRDRGSYRGGRNGSYRGGRGRGRAIVSNLSPLNQRQPLHDPSPIHHERDITDKGTQFKSLNQFKRYMNTVQKDLKPHLLYKNIDTWKSAIEFLSANYDADAFELFMKIFINQNIKEYPKLNEKIIIYSIFFNGDHFKLENVITLFFSSSFSGHTLNYEFLFGFFQ